MNPDQVFKIEIFQGEFLDIRSVITRWFDTCSHLSQFISCLRRLPSHWHFYLRHYSRLLQAPYFTEHLWDHRDRYLLRTLRRFRHIILPPSDYPQTIGPLFPFAQYDLLNSVFIPVSIYMAIAIVVTIFIFPQTANHAFLGIVTLLLSQTKALLDAQEDLLTTDPGSISPESPKILQLRATRASMFTIHQKCAFSSGSVSLSVSNHPSPKVTQMGKFINAEFSWGRWNGDDARQLEEPLLGVISRLSGWWCSSPCFPDSDFSKMAF